MGARLSHVFMVVSDLEAQRRLLVDVVGLHVLLDEGEYVRIGGDGGFNLGLEEGARGSSCDGLEMNIQVDDVFEVHRRLVDAGVRVEVDYPQRGVRVERAVRMIGQPATGVDRKSVV